MAGKIDGLPAIFCFANDLEMLAPFKNVTQKTSQLGDVICDQRTEALVIHDG